MMLMTILPFTRRFSRLWGQTIVVILMTIIIGSLLVYIYAQRQYALTLSKDYQTHLKTMQELQQEISQLFEQKNSFMLSGNERISQQLSGTIEKSLELLRVSVLDAQGNILLGKEAKVITEYFQTMSLSSQNASPGAKLLKNPPGSHEQVHIVQLPLMIHQQHVGFLRGEFFLINSGMALIQVTKITLQIIAVAVALMIFSGIVLIFSRITRHLSSKQHRLEEYALSLEQANENLRRARKDLQVSERLASLGYLAAGIAHEIGNPLGSVLGYIEILQKGTLDRGKTQDILQRIEKEIERIRRIIQELVNFSRPRAMNIEKVDINRIIRKTVSQIPSDPKKTVEIKLQLTEFPLFADVDEQKLQSVFFNIIRNGIDAISTSGSIHISTSRRIRESSRIIGGSEVIAIQFSDNGCGILEDHLSKVFDPFFTTKEPGEGMGLGLSLCHRIIESLNGEIEIQSTYGKGTDVAVFLPPARKKKHVSMSHEP
jgi:signal transduction histidine kinase